MEESITITCVNLPGSVAQRVASPTADSGVTSLILAPLLSWRLIIK